MFLDYQHISRSVLFHHELEVWVWCSHLCSVVLSFESDWEKKQRGGEAGGIKEEERKTQNEWEKWEEREKTRENSIDKGKREKEEKAMLDNRKRAQAEFEQASRGQQLEMMIFDRVTLDKSQRQSEEAGAQTEVDARGENEG